MKASLIIKIRSLFNHVLVEGKNYVSNKELLTSEEELSEDDTEDQDDESCKDVSGRQTIVLLTNLLAPARHSLVLGRLKLCDPLCAGLHVRVLYLH